MRGLLAVVAMLFAATAGGVEYPEVVPGVQLEFPRDEGSDPEFRTEWWYVTGWLEDDARGPQVDVRGSTEGGREFDDDRARDPEGDGARDREGDGARDPIGFQVTFFRVRPGLGETNPSRFAPRQILFAHAAIADPRRGRLRHAERSARAGFDLAEQASADAKPPEHGIHEDRADARGLAVVAIGKP